MGLVSVYSVYAMYYFTHIISSQISLSIVTRIASSFLCHHELYFLEGFLSIVQFNDSISSCYYQSNLIYLRSF